jgi:hypothetical protein
MWINEEGREVCRTYNLVPTITSPEIKQEDESPKKENKFRVGFDFALKGTAIQSSFSAAPPLRKIR